MAGPLEGLRVLDLSWGLAGPVAGMLLADYGADVVKVEPPDGDPYWGSAGYRVWQRGKRSVRLNLRREDERATFRRLVSEADVLLESFAPGVAARLRIDFADLAADNPRLVYCSITGYGREGAWAARPGYDLLVNARLGTYADQPGHREGPTFLATPTASYGAAWLAALGIGAALHARELSGRGQHVQTSLMQGALVYALMLWQRADQPLLKAIGRETWVPTLFECADGRWIHVMPQQHKHDLARLLDLDMGAGGGLTPSARLAPRSTEYRLHLNEQAAKRIKEQPSAHWLDFFDRADAPILPVQTAEEALDAEQIRINGMVATVEDPELGPLRQIGLPLRFSRTPGAIQGPSPRPGEHAGAGWRVRPDSGGTYARRNPAAAPHPGPLSGVRVLDFGHFLAGPYAPQLLADLGADVIKIERLEGDPMRPVDFSFLGCQRNKRALAIQMKDAAARPAIAKLLASADIVHHNMRPGAAERLGIDYESVRRLTPEVIYCHTPAFGTEGPMAGRPGLDQIFQAFGGGEAYCGGEGNPPMYNRQGAVDFANALLSAVGTVFALYHRDRTGAGQLVTGSLLNAGLFLNSDAMILGDGRGVEARGGARPRAASGLHPAPIAQRPTLDTAQTGFGPLYRLYETAQGWVAIAALREAEWRALCRALELPELAQDPRFATPETRREHAAALASVLEGAFRTRDADEWRERCDAAGAPCERADLSYEYDFFDDPAMLERNLVATYDHPRFGRLRNPGLLLDFSATPGAIRLPPPLIGQHTQEVLEELGYAAEDISRLREVGVVNWET